MYVVLVIAKILTIIGGLNWGLIGVFEFNLVDAIQQKAQRAPRVERHTSMALAG